MRKLASLLWLFAAVARLNGAPAASETGTLTAEAARPLMKDFIGLNSHAGGTDNGFKASFYRPASQLLRAYHSLAHDLGPDTSQPASLPLAKNGSDWTQAYAAWHAQGWEVDVSLRFEAIPPGRWKNLETDARTYARTFAREFGPSGPHPVVASVGLGNEPGNWSDADCHRIFRAMAQGVKEGDPALKIATCNLTTQSSGQWEKSVSTIAGLTDLFDILTVHTYAQIEGWPTWRRSFPEDPQLMNYLPDVEKLCQWRSKHVPGKPVWITEFGYDSSTKQPEPTGPTARWTGVTDKQQAQWIVRSFLVFSAMPVERAYLFFFDDQNEPKHHGSSGLTRFSQPKPSYYAVTHLQRVLGDYRFHRVVSNVPNDLRVQEYVCGHDPRRRIWALWSPTGQNRTSLRTLSGIPGKLLDAQRMPLDAAVPPSPKSDARQNPDGTVSAKVTESPLYLFLAPS